MKREKEEGKPGLLSRNILASKPAEWAEGLALRETFLIYIAPEPADFLRWLGKKYAAWMFEKNLAVHPSYRSSSAKGFLRGAMLDLRYIAWFLACTAQDLVETGAEPESEIAHGRLADALAVEVQSLADKIETRLNPKKKGTRNV
jgi:hypothetical protein